MHLFRDGAGKPTTEELEAKVEEMSLAESLENDADGIMLGVLAVPSWMTPSDFLDFVCPSRGGNIASADYQVRVSRSNADHILEFCRSETVFRIAR